MYGWNRCILRVNLKKRKITKQLLEKNLIQNFIGGRGINVKLLYDEVKPNIDPLGPDNKLIFGAGPFVGYPFGARINVTAKSPLTGFLGDSNAGGSWGPEFKRAGYDHIIIEDISKSPVYLFIDDDYVEIRNAEHLWGKGALETQRIIKEELGDPEIQVASIGPAGEKLVRFAHILCARRCASRTGMGAVMGSKKLKAIAVRGTKSFKVAEDDILDVYKQWIYWGTHVHDNKPFHYFTMGTAGVIDLESKLGSLPAYNWQRTTFEDIDKVGGIIFNKKYVKRLRACFGCPFHCDRYFRIDSGPFAGVAGEHAEAEVIAGLGARCGNSNIESILYMCNLLNEYGMDVVETSNIICTLMHLYQDKVITEKDVDGLKLEWGNYEAMIEIIHKIAKREGVGDVLAEGAYQAARKLKKGAEKYVVHVKRLTSTSAELRAFKAGFLSFATSSRGCDHLRGFPPVEYRPSKLIEEMFGSKEVCIPTSYDTIGKPKAVAWWENLGAAIDALGVCKFHTVFFYVFHPPWPDDLAKIFTKITGVKMDGDTLMKAGERIYNVERLFNIREGLRREHDYWCERMYMEPLPDGPYKGEVVDKEKYGKMLSSYYRVRGWDEEGIPTEEKLRELGLTP